jgi:magnesium chelatase family protein
VNLAPADLPKDSGRFDLPIALGLLAASGQIDGARLAGHEFAGELSLSGELRPVRGALATSLALQAAGVAARLVLPPGSAEEAALVPGAHVIARATCWTWCGSSRPPPEDCQEHDPTVDALRARRAGGRGSYPTLADVKGQAGARARWRSPRRRPQPSAWWAAGAGKSMLAQRFAGLLPAHERAEALESAAVASLAGRFALRTGRSGDGRRITPASAVALVGWRLAAAAGEISLAHHGVCSSTNCPKFPRAALEALREPLETGRITSPAAPAASEFPARFQLVAAMNPCPAAGSARRAPAAARPEQVARYQGAERAAARSHRPARRSAGAGRPRNCWTRRPAKRARRCRRAARRARAGAAAPGQGQPRAAGRGDRLPRRPGASGIGVPAPRVQPPRLERTRHPPRAEGGAHHRRPGGGAASGVMHAAEAVQYRRCCRGL